MDQFKRLLHSSDRNLLFAISSVACSHDHVDEALNDWALNFLESTLLVAPSGVWDVNLLFNSLDLEVRSETDIRSFNPLVRPLAEQFGLESKFWLSVDLITD